MPAIGLASIASPPAQRYRVHDGRQVHPLSVLDTSTGIVLAQVTVDAKSNEIPAFTPLLDVVHKVVGSLKGMVFVADALHTQTGHAQQVAATGPI
ncbi:transposase [Actinosynnema pretiosum]|uniref:transposase n=1 Tax=Actinosynnema pretiosum TaxID=42197 RepID=UPI0018DF597D|nr:transposase [Actinosynnema pretiosum]